MGERLAKRSKRKRRERGMREDDVVKGEEKVVEYRTGRGS